MLNVNITIVALNQIELDVPMLSKTIIHFWGLEKLLNALAFRLRPLAVFQASSAVYFLRKHGTPSSISLKCSTKDLFVHFCETVSRLKEVLSEYKLTKERLGRFWYVAFSIFIFFTSVTYTRRSNSSEHFNLATKTFECVNYLTRRLFRCSALSKIWTFCNDRHYQFSGFFFISCYILTR